MNKNLVMVLIILAIVAVLIFIMLFKVMTPKQNFKEEETSLYKKYYTEVYQVL